MCGDESARCRAKCWRVRELDNYWRSELLVVIYWLPRPARAGRWTGGVESRPEMCTSTHRGVALGCLRVSAAGRGLLPAPPPDPGPRGGPAARAAAGVPRAGGRRRSLSYPRR